MTSPRIATLADEIQRIAPDPRNGLGEELFLLVSTLTPMVNIDLLVKDVHGRTLLTWREDRYYAPGWHVPGGIVRFKEPCAERVHAVARNELGIDVICDNRPIAINEMIHSTRSERGHFIALLYRCTSTSQPDSRLAYAGGRPLPGQWKWHANCPEDLVTIQQVYRQFI